MEPLTIENEIELHDLPRQSFVEITYLPQQRVVTEIELLSPSNKRKGDGRTAYLAKRRDLVLREINLIEHDLRLGGERLPLRRELPPGDYYGLNTCGPNWDKTNVYSWTLVVEVLNESNTAREMQRKRGEYFSAGVRLLWEVDLPSRSISVYTSSSQPTVLYESDILTGGDVLPGFTMEIRSLFAELPE